MRRYHEKGPDHVIGWECKCSYKNAAASGKCWKCQGDKATHLKRDIRSKDITEGGLIEYVD